MTDAVSVEQLVAWLSSFRDVVHENRDHLTELDSAIGDADHGVNLTRGMDAVMAAVVPPPGTPGELLKKVGMALGERSVGHVDPGAASSTLLLEALADALSAA